MPFFYFYNFMVYNIINLQNKTTPKHSHLDSHWFAYFSAVNLSFIIVHLLSDEIIIDL